MKLSEIEKLSIDELFGLLSNFYRAEKLNKIAVTLISYYKEKNQAAIFEIANRISSFIPLPTEHFAPCFAKLMMLYHPDREQHMQKELKLAFQDKNYNKLKGFAHILVVDGMPKIEKQSIDYDLDFESDYVWDETSAGFQMDDDSYEDEEIEDYERNFYNLIKIREYGMVDIEFPSYYLEDMEDFELSQCGLISLEGVEFCKQIKSLDCSQNELFDLSPLWDLQSLEELYLGHNQISTLDDLSNLNSLKVLDLSFNLIQDIEPLLHLPLLEYVNITGNKVSKYQVNQLKNKDITVIYN